MAEKFKLSIISPDRVFTEGEAEFLEFTSTEGELGIYAQHIPLTTILEPCVMKIHNEGEVKKAAILGGFVEILKDKITVLAEDAQWPDDIDVARAQAAKKRAEERRGVAQIFRMPLHAYVKGRCVTFGRFDNGAARPGYFKQRGNIANCLMVHGIDEERQGVVRLFGVLFAVYGVERRSG